MAQRLDKTVLHSARGAFHPGTRPRSGSPAQVCSRSPQHERESFFECHDRLRILQSLLGARGRRDSSCLRVARETTNLAVRSSNLFGRAHSVQSCSPSLADTALNHATRSSRASPIRPMPGRGSYIGFVQGAKSGVVILANSTKCPVTRVGTGDSYCPQRAGSSDELTESRRGGNSSRT